MLSDAELSSIADRLAAVSGMVGVTLGGSRARGSALPGSDVDLGLYYRGGLDIEVLGALARELSGPRTEVTAIGEWGPRVNGGGWLTIGGQAVDWIYRDLDEVDACWRRASRGDVVLHVQSGHPAGFPDWAYAGELASAVLLADPAGELAARRTEMSHYPRALAQAQQRGLWEADFCVGIARKGAVASAARLPGCPTDFEGPVQALMGGVGTAAAELARTIDDAAAVVAEVKSALARSRPWAGSNSERTGRQGSSPTAPRRLHGGLGGRCWRGPAGGICDQLGDAVGVEHVGGRDGVTAADVVERRPDPVERYPTQLADGQPVAGQLHARR